ncbi:MAG: photosynthetic reaction center cytochrome PufC [Acetobacteraceae bacterium]|nr:photosynthetic reaction center cytochrome PufC [Acetobacteraceae bacterium]
MSRKKDFDLVSTVGWTATAVLGVAAAFYLASTFERPPVTAIQWGPRGTAMELVYNPRTVVRNLPRHAVPAKEEEVEKSGIPSREAYQNVQVLGDLDSAEFLRLMNAITAWVSPQQGCNYCHNPENLADDSVYTKVVTRKMLQMTKVINESWQAHVGQTGVTCWTCHRGQPVPAYVWSTETPQAGAAHARADDHRGGTEHRLHRGRAFVAADRSVHALPARGQADPSHHHLDADVARRQPDVDQADRVDLCADVPLHRGDGRQLHLLPQLAKLRQMGRVDAATRHRLARHLHDAGDQQRLDRPAHAALAGESEGPARGRCGGQLWRGVGPMGDALKVNCLTCHQGAHKPMLGARMLADYPELNAVSLSPVPLRAAMR